MVDEDTPTEEMIERMEEKLQSAQSEQKNLFLIIFQVTRMHTILSVWNPVQKFHSKHGHIGVLKC
jgi:hypothetical protein